MKMLDLGEGIAIDLDRLSPKQQEVIQYLIDGITVDEFIERTERFSKIDLALLRGVLYRAQSLPNRSDWMLAKEWTEREILRNVLRRSLGPETKGPETPRTPREALKMPGKAPVTIADAVLPKPPKSALFLLLLVPKKYRENLVGDLDEEFITIVLPRCGPRKARIWYWCQVAAGITPIVWAQVKRLAGLALLWKTIR